MSTEHQWDIDLGRVIVAALVEMGYDARHHVEGKDVAEAIEASTWLRDLVSDVWDEGNLSGGRWGTAQTYPIDIDVPAENPYRRGKPILLDPMVNQECGHVGCVTRLRIPEATATTGVRIYCGRHAQEIRAAGDIECSATVSWGRCGLSCDDA